MDPIELVPSLSQCIETRARDEFWNLANRYMVDGRKNQRLEERIDLLKAFLESANFARLRSDSEKHLTQGREVRFVIRWKEGNPSYEMVVTQG
jgi:hypothetical protein